MIIIFKWQMIGAYLNKMKLCKGCIDKGRTRHSPACDHSTRLNSVCTHLQGCCACRAQVVACTMCIHFYADTSKGVSTSGTYQGYACVTGKHFNLLAVLSTNDASRMLCCQYSSKRKGQTFTSAPHQILTRSTYAILCPAYLARPHHACFTAP